MKRTVINWAGLIAVGAAAAILTFNTLRALAESCGFHGWLGWLLPVAVDAAGAVATNVWLAGKDNVQAVRFARTWALTAAGVSLVGNATEHGLAAYGMSAPWWVAVAVAVVPPLALVGTVHLMVLLSKGTHETRTPESVLDNRRPAPVASEKKESAPPPVGIRAESSDPVVEMVKAFVAENPDAGRPTVARELNISDYSARKALAALNGHAK